MNGSPNHIRGVRILGWVLILANVAAQDRAARVPVFGVVRDTAGKPVANADVRVVRFEHDGLPSYQSDQLDIPLVESNATRTDERGRFVLRLGGASRFGVVAVHGKGLRSAVVAPVAPGSQVELVLRRVLTMRGRIVNKVDDKSIPAIKAQVRSYATGESVVIAQPWPDLRMGRLDTAWTGAKGEFALRILSGVSCRIEYGRASFKLTAAEDPPFTILARELFRVSGSVVDEATKKPIPGASLAIGRRRIRADRKGRFDILVPESSRIVDFAAPGFALLRHRFEGAGRGDVALARAPMVRMRVVNGEGEPCGQHEMCVLQLASGPTGSGPLLTQRKTEQDGTLRVPVGPKGYGFIAWARVVNRWVRVCDAPRAADGHLDLGDLSIATYDLHGTVVDERGLPAANVPLFAGPTKPAFGGRMPLAQHPLAYTDHGGRFRIVGLPRRAFDVAAQSAGSLTTFGPVVRGPTKTPVRLQLHPAQRIQGQVVDDLGKPVAGAIVSARAFRAASERLRRFGRWANYAKTDALGRFSAAVVVKGAPHQLMAQKIGEPGRSEEVQADPGAVDVVLTLPRSK